MESWPLDNQRSPHSISFLNRTCQWVHSFSLSESSSDQNTSLGIRKLAFWYFHWMSHWITHCARSWPGSKILSFMDEKNCITKSTDDCQRVLRKQSEQTGQHWVQDFSSLLSAYGNRTCARSPTFHAWQPPHSDRCPQRLDAGPHANIAAPLSWDLLLCLWLTLPRSVPAEGQLPEQGFWPRWNVLDMHSTGHHKPQMLTEHLKCDYYNWQTRFLLYFI